MDDRPYTLGRWKAKPGREAELVEAWTALAELFFQLPQPPGTGRLVQSVDDPTLFYSFGPWESLDDIAAMRAHPDTAEVMGSLVALCDEATPGTFRVAAEIGP